MDPAGSGPKSKQQKLITSFIRLAGKRFQNLSATIAAEVWGQTVQTFFDSHDGGRDGAFHGMWRSSAGEDFEGTFTVQCKFTSKADKQLQLADLKDELAKAHRLASRGLSDCYFLFQTPDSPASPKGKSAPRLKQFTASNDLQRSGANVSPASFESRHDFECWCLVSMVSATSARFFDERAYDQAREILSALGDDLAKFVITEAYQHSAKALVEHGFVLLLGEPACGKSTIAAALAVGALDEWGCSTLKIRDADDFIAHSNPHEPKQFFWVDDAFGGDSV